MTNWGPTGQTVFERTYSRDRPDGTKETWPQAVARVAHGNLAYVYDDPSQWSEAVYEEYEELTQAMEAFDIIPGGRHLWVTGTGHGQEQTSNCWVAGWDERLSVHFEWTFLRLMSGGGVGANYSKRPHYPAPTRLLDVHIVCGDHKDNAAMRSAGLLSEAYGDDWLGAYEVEDSREGWAEALSDLIDTYYREDTVRHQCRVYDLCRVRPSGAKLKRFGGTASGPAALAILLQGVCDVLNMAAARGRLTSLDLMEIDHLIGQAVVAGGVRRSARMSIVHWDDEDVFEFIKCKTDPAKHWTTNISVGIDSTFLDELAGGWDAATAVHDAVVAGMLTNGEPGYWNETLSNEGEIEPVYATNPCGEIVMQPWENCNLGHVNMQNFVGRPGRELHRAHELMARFLVRATFDDTDEPRALAIRNKNRRIGVGHFGVQGYLALHGVRYSQAPSVIWFRELLETLYDTTRAAADRYAFELRIPAPIKVTTVAPTGTVAKLPGVTEGIQAVYARHFIRRIRYSTTNPEQEAAVTALFRKGHTVETDMYAADTACVEFPMTDPLVAAVLRAGLKEEIVESQDELSVEDVLAFQAMYQELWADNAVSMTVNIGEDVTAEELDNALRDYLPRLKGTTVFPDLSRPQSPYERQSAGQVAAWNRSLESIEDSFDENCATGACPVR